MLSQRHNQRIGPETSDEVYNNSEVDTKQEEQLPSGTRRTGRSCGHDWQNGTTTERSAVFWVLCKQKKFERHNNWLKPLPKKGVKYIR